ncbi:MAG TPA: signal recognition particle-docking protein FtsY [Candidatus Nanoarchaeia archaeon]|nr:signal recognition particle-docking protein FtsY [Candidatus Nanoarchaeia archaeon]
MFGFLKDKLKAAVAKFSKDVEKEVDEVEKKAPKKDVKKSAKKEKPSKKESAEEKSSKKEKATSKKEVKESKKEEKEVYLPSPEAREEKKGFFSKLFSRTEEQPTDAEEAEVDAEVEDDELSPKEAAFEEGEADAELLEEPEEKKGFFSKITEAVTKTSLSEEKFEALFWDLEIILLENNVAVEVIEKIKNDMKESLVKGKISRFDVDKTILATLKKSIDDILSFDVPDLLKETKDKKPLILAFVGVNGSGKTTTIAKLAQYFIKNKKTVVMAAADTFRAAAIHQLEEHANKLNVKLVKHNYGADAAAVAFDAVKYAEAHKIDVVLIDTAGRLHSNTNLMDEMKKIIRVAKPHYKVFIGESITGNDCIEQAQQFNAAIEIDGIMLSKADVDEKGGASISVAYVTKKPIMFIGTGQTYDDLKPFDKNEIIKTLGL